MKKMVTVNQSPAGFCWFRLGARWSRLSNWHQHRVALSAAQTLFPSCSGSHLGHVLLLTPLHRFNGALRQYVHLPITQRY